MTWTTHFGGSIRTQQLDNVIPAIDMKRLAGDEAGCIMSEESRGDADIVDAHEAPRRRLGFGLVEQRVEFGNSGCRGSWSFYTT